MFGNVSKSLIKVPNHFNINIESEPKTFSKKAYEKIINTNRNLRKINFYKSNKHPHYFKERDFIKKNLHLDLNYNNNFRKNITPHVKPRLSLSFEEFIFGKSFNNTKDSNANKDSNLLIFNSRFNTDTGTNFSINSRKEFFSSKNSLNSRESNSIIKNMTKLDNEEFNDNLNTNIDKLIKRIHENSLNFNLFKKKKGFGATRQERIQILKDFINGDRVVIPPPKFKYPKLNIKSNENIYRDTLDKKLTSLSMLSPKVKEQLKTKNRYFTSQKEFYKFTNSYFSNRKNPLTETVKCLEEKENKNEK